jgi:hypothetical protein
MQYKETLYMKDQLENIRYWKVDINDATYKIEFGILNTEHPQIIERTIKVGKNLGKSNMTSCDKQCIKEVESIYKNQLKKGYKSISDLNINNKNITTNDLKLLLDTFLSKYKTDNNGIIKPMLAQKYKIGSIDFPCYIQPKINGVRNTTHRKIINDGLFGSKEEISFLSREGLEYNVEHISKLLNNIDKNLILDGEFYISGQPVTSIGGAVRNKQNSLHNNICYIVFDLAIANTSQQERIEILNNLNCILHHNTILHKNNKCKTDIDLFCNLNKNKEFKNNVYIIPTIEVNNENEIQEWNDIFLDCGFEGTIIRDKFAEYEFGIRSKNMRKLKRFEDTEFIIFDIIPYEKDEYLCKFICKNDINDEIFETIPLGNREERHEYLINKQKYIGKKVTVKFYERSITGVPFHSNAIGIRNYE